MEKQAVVDNENIVLWYYPDTNIIHHEFHKFTQGKLLRDTLSAGAKLLEKNKVQKWLSDDRKNSVIGKEDMDWTATVWRPRVIKGGWKYWALVLPEKAIGQMNMKQIIQQYADTGVTVQIFTNADEALKWLEAQ
jgi:hypothetical protein